MYACVKYGLFTYDVPTRRIQRYPDKLLTLTHADLSGYESVEYWLSAFLSSIPSLSSIPFLLLLFFSPLDLLFVVLMYICIFRYQFTWYVEGLHRYGLLESVTGIWSAGRAGAITSLRLGIARWVCITREQVVKTREDHTSRRVRAGEQRDRGKNEYVQDDGEQISSCERSYAHACSSQRATDSTARHIRTFPWSDVRSLPHGRLRCRRYPLFSPGAPQSVPCVLPLSKRFSP